MNLPRLLAWIHLVYGLVALVGGGLGGVVLAVQTLDSHGCDGMALLVATILLAILCLAGAPQAFFARRYLRDAPNAARSMARLSVVNLALNLAVPGLIAAGGVPAAFLFVVPALVVNVLTLVVMRRDSARGAEAVATGA